MAASVALIIANNYPVNIHISAGYNTNKKGWYGSVFLIRNGEIQRILISHVPRYQKPFKSAKEAEDHLKEICEGIVKSNQEEKLK